MSSSDYGTPLLSITVPTLDSERTLGRTLESIASQVQSPLPTELIVVDNGSKDRTTDIAKRAGAQVLTNQKGLLRSRCMGIEQSRGEFTLLLDSDQVLAKDALRRLADALRLADVIFLDEHAAEMVSPLEHLYGRDRDVVQRIEQFRFDPVSGTTLPRAFRSSLLKRAIANIPGQVRDRVVYRDHAIICFEVGKIDSVATVVPNAVFHNENRSLGSLVRKHFQYGLDDAYLMSEPRYVHLINAKQRRRVDFISEGTVTERLTIGFLTAMKLFPYLAGLALPEVTSRRRMEALFANR